MITELAILGIGSYAYSWYKDNWKREIKREFQHVMDGCNLYNKMDETFNIYDIEKKEYGYLLTITIPKGLSLDHLLSKQNVLEDNLNSIIEIIKNKFSSCAKMYLINKDVDNYKYVPVECRVDKLWIGKDIKGNDCFIDLNKDPHILIGGVTGTGKSFLLASMLTNAIYYNANQMEIYLSQLVKGEIGAFKYCKGVKAVSYSENEAYKTLEHVCNILDNRAELFTQYGIKNIKQWNKHFRNRYMKRIIYVIEEFSFFQETELWPFILKIVKAGRSVGVHLIGLLQRSTATNLNTDVKSQMTRITFRQKSSIDSTNIINIPDAIGLKDRECIIDANDDIIRVKTAWIDEDFLILNKYVNSIMIPHKPKKETIINVIENKVKELKEPTPEVIVEKKENKHSKRKRKGVISLEELEEVDK